MITIYKLTIKRAELEPIGFYDDVRYYTTREAAIETINLIEAQELQFYGKYLHYKGYKLEVIKVLEEAAL